MLPGCRNIAPHFITARVGRRHASRHTLSARRKSNRVARDKRGHGIADVQGESIRRNPL